MSHSSDNAEYLATRPPGNSLFPQQHFFLAKSFLTFIWNLKVPRVAKTNLTKKKTVGGIILPDFKTYYKVIVVKTM